VNDGDFAALLRSSHCQLYGAAYECGVRRRCPRQIEHPDRRLRSPRNMLRGLRYQNCSRSGLVIPSLATSSVYHNAPTTVLLSYSIARCAKIEHLDCVSIILF